MAVPPGTYALPICPACRVSIMLPAGRVGECDGCGRLRLPHVDDWHEHEIEA